MMKAVILAGGSVEKRPRHLRFSWTKFNKVIDNSVLACLRADVEFSVVCNRSNNQLIDYLSKKYQDIELLFPKDELMLSTFEVAFNHDSYQTDKIVIAGDLLKIEPQTLREMSMHHDVDAICTMDVPWHDESHLIGVDPSLEFRTDLGQGVFLISKQSQRKFTEKWFVSEALKVRTRFKGIGDFNETTSNDVWTWLLYFLFAKAYGHSQENGVTSTQKILDLRVSTADDYDLLSLTGRLRQAAASLRHRF